MPCDPAENRAEAALDRHRGRTRRIYEKLMMDQGGMVYLEVTSAERKPDNRRPDS